MKRSLPLLLSAFLVLLGLPLLPESGSADPFGAIMIEGPIPFDDPAGPPNIPGGGHTPAEVGVLEEEFFYSGSVDVFTYEEGNVHLGEKVIKDEDVDRPVPLALTLEFGFSGATQGSPEASQGYPFSLTALGLH